MVLAYRERTIAFYQVKKLVNGEEENFPNQLDFLAMLKELEHTPLDERTVNQDNDLIGTAVSWDGMLELALDKVKDAGDWIAYANYKTGQLHRLETGDGEGYLDTSVICFAPYGNLLGMMHGSVGSPTHKALEFWLRKLSGFGDDLVVRPVIATGEYDRFKKGVALQRLEIKVGKKLDLREKSGYLAEALRTLKNRYGDLNVTITVSSPPGKMRRKREDARERLYEDVVQLGDAVRLADRARVGLLYAEGDDYGRTRITELVEHHITAKRKVPSVDADGNAISISGAINAIRLEFGEQEDALRAALED